MKSEKDMGDDAGMIMRRVLDPYENKFENILRLLAISQKMGVDHNNWLVVTGT